jgi:DNA polymerase I-like protein with 3'-5' exonuclease and polymerase domains
LFLVEVEMPALLCLARVELNGIGFNKDEAERLRDLLEQQLTALEQHVYKIAGHTFSLTSSADVSKVKTEFQ